jgi:hypothetical protein
MSEITTCYPHGIKEGDLTDMFGKTFKVTSVKSENTFTIKKLNIFERIYYSTKRVFRKIRDLFSITKG